MTIIILKWYIYYNNTGHIVINIVISYLTAFYGILRYCTDVLKI